MNYKAFISYKHGDDDALAKSLEKALEKFAKPTFKRRAIEVFRDGNDLSAAADLGEKIRNGLKTSEFFVCMASPKYAASKWCVREAEYWRDNKSVDNFLIVLTDGEILWDESTNDFDWSVTTAMPKEMSGVFKGEPFYIDFRNSGPKEQLNLDNPDFKNRLVLLAATLHGKSIGDMVGEAAKQHKRTMRIRNSAIGIIMLFMGISLFLTILSNQRKDASLLHFQAKAIESDDPSLALRLEEEALDIYNNDDFRTSAYSLISKNAFYKILTKSDSLPYSAMTIDKSDNTIWFGNNESFVKSIDSNGSSLVEFKVGKGVIHDIACTTDGLAIAIATDNGAHLYSKEGLLLHSFNSISAVNRVIFSSDNKLLITVSNKTVQLFRLDGSIVSEFETLSSINAIDISDDNQTLLIGLSHSFHTAQLLDLDGNIIQTIGNYDVVNSVTFSPDGKNILTGSWDNTAKLWDLEGKLVQEFNHRSNQLLPDRNSTLTAVFSPDGQMVLTGTWENKAKLWDLKGNLIKEFKGHTDGITDVDFLSDGKTVITNSSDNTIRIWNAEGLTGNLETSIEAHSDRVTSITFMSNDEFITSSEDKTAKTWNISGNQLTEFKGHQAGIITSAIVNNNSVYTGARDGNIHLWYINGTLQKEISTKTFITNLVMSPDGNSMLVSDLMEGTNMYDMEFNKKLEFGPTKTVNYAPNGQYIAVGTDEGTQIWDINGNLLTTIKSLQTDVQALAFSPDSKQIISCTSDRTARLWDLQGKLISEFDLDEITVSHAAFSPDGKSILIGSVDSYLTYGGTGIASVGLWDLEGNLIMRFKNDKKESTAMAFSPDNSIIALGYDDGTINLYTTSSIEDFLDEYVQPLSDKLKDDYNID